MQEGGIMDVVARWTGRHGLALVEAMRLSREAFADKTGISARAIADWAKKPTITLLQKTQADLDTTFEKASEQVRRRFELILAETEAPTIDLSPQPKEPPAPTSLTSLLNVDLSNDDAAPHEPNSGTWHDAALTWLVSEAPAAQLESGIVRVGAGDLARLRSTISLYEELDNRHGGGNGRLALAQYMQTEALPLLDNAHPKTRTDLFATVAEGMLTLAWMSYDAGMHRHAQGYFVEALKIARESGDRSLGASILDAMSHQATFLGKYREAANLAAAARMGTVSLAAPTLEAHFHVMEARAFAGAGETHACDAALSRAVTAFERGSPDDAPEWIRYFDEVEFNAELGHCNRDLGRAGEATGYARAAVDATTGEFVRSDFFASMVLADAQLDQGELEHGCATAIKALEIGEQVRSARCATYVQEFRQRLSRFGNAKSIRSFTAEAERRSLWLPGAA